VDAYGRAEGDTRDMCGLNPDDAKEGGDLICVTLSRVRPRRLVALARAGKIERDTREVLSVGRELKRVAGVVRGGVRDQQERLPFPCTS
jgi:hypothetical protein